MAIPMRADATDEDRKMVDAILDAVINHSAGDTTKRVVNASTVIDALMSVAAFFLAQHPDAPIPSRRRKLCREHFGRLLEDATAAAIEERDANSNVFVIPPPSPTRQ